jgi:hypothetical protein
MFGPNRGQTVGEISVTETDGGSMRGANDYESKQLAYRQRWQ